MIEPELEKTLKARLDRTNKVIQTSIVSILVVIIVMLGAILWQNEMNLDRSRDLAAQNHKRTQAYVKCVAVTLTKPLAQRSDDELDKCTTNADTKTKAAESQGK